MPDLSPDTVEQIITTVVIGIIAVAGSIGGAIRGAEGGARATMEATAQAIAAQKRETQEQRPHEDRVLIRTLATEYRFNGNHRGAGLCAFLLFVGFLGFTQAWSGGEEETVASHSVPDLPAQAATPLPRSSSIAAASDWPDCVWEGNPGNPSCLTVGLAAGCAIDATGPGCSVDSDGDGCIDVAEAEAGFDPFDPADCVGGSGGQPAINCLFLMENLSCNGDRIADLEENECIAEREIRQRRNPTSFSGCDGVDQPPLDACVYNARDPGCDGFSRESG